MVSQKILYVIGSLDLGGTERHVSLISQLLKQMGWEPIIYCITRRGIQGDIVEKSGVKVVGPPWELKPYQTGIGKFFRLLASCIKLFHLMLFQRPHIVHFYLPVAYLIGAPLAILSRLPILVMSRRSLNNYQTKHPILARLEQRLHHRMTAILANSKSIVSQLVETESCDRDKVQVIYNGVELTYWSDATGHDKVSSPDNANELTIIIVANLIPYKGHNDLIAALAMIQDRLPKRWQLRCVGRDDGFRVKLEAQIKTLNLDSQIRFMGERTDAAQLLREADIGILCSHEEGFSNAILEGMAAGLPMVVTDVGGNAEAIVDGETGFLVAPRDPAGLGAAILKLALDPTVRTKMGAAGRKRVEELYTIEKCVSNYDRFYRALVTSREER